jgi:hypothetical protein
MFVCLIVVLYFVENSLAQIVSRNDLVKRLQNSQQYFQEVVMDAETAIPLGVLRW